MLERESPDRSAGLAAVGAGDRPSAPTVTVVDPDDWLAFRRIRLEALQDAPWAFGSTYAREAAFDEAEWRSRLSRRSTFWARLSDLGADPVGIAGGYVPLEAPDTVELVSMWVRPVARGRRVGETLIEAVHDWACGTGAHTLHLWVTASNQPAARLYERCGFTPTGEGQPLPSNPDLVEIGMARPLRRS